jgi:hypothetical protein
LIAVASVHESVEISENTSTGYEDAVARKRRAYSLIHYNKAIQLLIRGNENSCDRLATALIMCILFIVFEEFQSDWTSCALHLQSGLALLHQWTSTKTVPRKPGNKLRHHTDLIKNHVGPVLNRLLVQASTFADSRIHAEQHIRYSARPFAPVVPQRFVSFTEAKEALDEFMMWMFYSVNHPEPQSVPRVRAMLEQTLKTWLQAFNHLLPCTEANLEPPDLRAARFMQMYYHVSFIIIDAYLADDELVFDKHVQRFGKIVDMSQGTFSTDAGKDEQHKVSFNFDFGVTPPLYFTASHCRDPLIRRRALALIRLSHRKQGCWNSEHSAKCAEQIIKIEEASLGLVKSCEDVPEEVRIRKVYAEVQHEKGCIKMAYVHAPYDLKAPLRTVYIPLRSDAVQCCVAERLASGIRLDEYPRHSPDERTSITGFVSKTYFPQETI